MSTKLSPPRSRLSPARCSAREWEARATEYFQLNAPDGACETCKWLRPEDPPTAEKSHWCVLVEGTCRDQDCHLCPGVNPPAAGEVRRNAVTSTGLLAVQLPHPKG
jgi:hypothetical protein